MTTGDAGLHVLALNSGSSSLKFGLYRVGAAGVEALLSGRAEHLSGGHGDFHARFAAGADDVGETGVIGDQQQAIERIARLLDEAGLPAPQAVGHRIVHGGASLLKHCLVDDTVLAQLDAAAAFAPLHTPPAVAVLRFAQQHFAGLPQVACFDTAFHADLPDVARTLTIDKRLQTDGVRRYGFHGLSCESILHRLGDDVPPRTVIAHLGSGASVTAVAHGRSIDTSMGLTPSGGLMMATRSGDLDPGLLTYLLRAKRIAPDDLEALIDHRSGLLGVSGSTGDLQRLQADAAHDADARLAVDMFGYSVRKHVAAMAAALGGIDLLVFSGGIGEHDAALRSAVCAGLAWMGISLDEAANDSSLETVSATASRCAVRVLAAQEEEQIARLTRAAIDAV